MGASVLYVQIILISNAGIGDNSILSSTYIVYNTYICSCISSILPSGGYGSFIIMQGKLTITTPPTKLPLKNLTNTPSLPYPRNRFPHSHLPQPSFQSPHNRPNQALLLQTNPPNRHMPSVANKLNPAGRIFPLLIALGTLLPANTRLAASAISAP